MPLPRMFASGFPARQGQQHVAAGASFLYGVYCKLLSFNVTYIAQTCHETKIIGAGAMVEVQQHKIRVEYSAKYKYNRVSTHLQIIDSPQGPAYAPVRAKKCG